MQKIPGILFMALILFLLISALCPVAFVLLPQLTMTVLPSIPMAIGTSAVSAGGCVFFSNLNKQPFKPPLNKLCEALSRMPVPA